MSCAVHAVCGGCPMLSVSRRDELRTKRDLVSSALERAGIQAVVAWAQSTASDSADVNRFGYRNRLRMKVVDGRADFFNHAKRDGCPVVRPDLWNAIEQLRLVSSQEPELLAGVEHLEVRVGDSGEVGLMLSDPVQRDLLVAALGPDWRVADPSVPIPPTLGYLVGLPELRVEVPVSSFVQVNSAVNRQLVNNVMRVADDVLDRSGPGKPAGHRPTFLDLYSGAGNFALPLAARGMAGTAVETVGDAVAALARTGAARSGAIECLEGSVPDVLHRLRPAEFIVADPPRSGLRLDDDGYGHLASLTKDSLVLIGCNVDAFARDLASLHASGLGIESVTAFDMFPGTRHVETLGVLRSASC